MAVSTGGAAPLTVRRRDLLDSVEPDWMGVTDDSDLLRRTAHRKGRLSLWKTYLKVITHQACLWKGLDLAVRLVLRDIGRILRFLGLPISPIWGKRW